MAGVFCHLIQFYMMLAISVVLHWVFLLYAASISPASPSLDSKLYASCLILLVGTIAFLTRLRFIFSYGRDQGQEGRCEAIYWTCTFLVFVALTILSGWLFYASYTTLGEVGSAGILSVLSAIVGTRWAEKVAEVKVKVVVKQAEISQIKVKLETDRQDWLKSAK